MLFEWSGDQRMTQYPGYANPALVPPAANPRPTSVTVVAIIGIVWGVLMLLCNGIGMASAFIPTNFAGPNPAAEELRSNAVAHLWGIANPLMGFVLAFILLAGCAGALGMKSWGRAAMNLFAVLEIIVAIAHTIVTILVINPIISRNLPLFTGGAGSAGAPSAQMMSTFQHAGVIATAVIALVYPIVVLIVMNTRSVKAAFQNKAAGAGGTSFPAGQPGYLQQQPMPGQYPMPPQAPPGQGPYSPPPQ
jgi:hypothetical protein